MCKLNSQQTAQDIVRSAQGFRLTPFQDILSDILEQHNSLANLAQLDCLELGPANLVDMMRFLKIEARVKSMLGIGRGIRWPWTRHRAFIRDHTQNRPFLDYFKNNRSTHFDLIYSRHVMEQHSIDPWILLGSHAYWAQFKKQSFTDYDEHYPASPPNIQMTFNHAYRALKPGGLIVSQIAKQRFSCLDEAFLKTLKPSHISRRSIGRLSCIVTVIK
jgi:hypothetical protein